MSILKTCSNCKKTKPISEFHPRKISRDGYRGTCKACMGGQARKYRHSEKGRQTRAEYHEQNREAISERGRKLHRRKKRERDDAALRELLERDKKNPHEEWRDIPGFPAYQVSNFGRVRRIRSGPSTWVGKTLSPATNSDGYLHFNLRKGKANKTVAAHRLVARAFLGYKREDGIEINHKDGNKLNNSPDNLEFVTHRRNMIHAAQMGLLGERGGERNGNAKLTDEQVKEIRATFRPGIDTCKEFGRRYGVNYRTISLVVSGKSWKHID